jgi:hypothetical protein
VVPITSNPPAAFQPDGSRNLETGGVRFGSAVFEQGSSLWAVASTGFDCDGPGPGGTNSSLRWYEIDEPTNAVLQSGTICDIDHDYFYPSISANEFGEVLIGFSKSGLTEFPSAYAIGGTTTAGVTTFGSPILLHAGLDSYFEDFGSGRNRWGDYSATTLDPLDHHCFWTIQEWANTPVDLDGDGDPDDDRWSTQIAQLCFPTGPGVVPEPASLTLLGMGAFGLLGYRFRSRKQAA